MNLYEHMLLQAREGLAEIHRERDRALTFMARYGGGAPIDVLLGRLEVEQQQHAMVIAGIAELRKLNHPSLLLPVRTTRMAKMTLRPAMSDRRTGTER